MVVGHADERVARRVDRGHDLARAIARLELPRGEREVARVAADLERARGGEVLAPEAPHHGRVGPDLAAEPRHEDGDAVDEVPLARLALEAAEVVGVNPGPAVGVLGAPQMRLAAARPADAEVAAREGHRPPEVE